MSGPPTKTPFQFKANASKVIGPLRKKIKQTESLLIKESPDNQMTNNYQAINSCPGNSNNTPEQTSVPVSSDEPLSQSPKNNPVRHLFLGFWSDFFQFLMVTDVFSLGVGIIIGTIFTEVINSFVTDIITPPVGLLLGGAQLENLFLVLKPGRTKKAIYSTIEQALNDGAVTMNFGHFFLTLLRFFLVALILFWLIQAYQIIQQEQEKLKLAEKLEDGAQKFKLLLSPKPSPKNLPEVPIDISDPASSNFKKNVSTPLESPRRDNSGIMGFLDDEEDFNPNKAKNNSTSGLGLSNTTKPKECPFCLSILPCKAKVLRCGHCTTILEPNLFQAALDGIKSSPPQ